MGKESTFLPSMCLFCLCAGNEQQSEGGGGGGVAGVWVPRIKHKHTQTGRHSHFPPGAGCDMLSEMLAFKVMRLASEPFSSG